MSLKDQKIKISNMALDYFSEFPKPDTDEIARNILNDTNNLDTEFDICKETLACTCAAETKDYSLTGYVMFGRRENKDVFIKRLARLDGHLRHFRSHVMRTLYAKRYIKHWYHRALRPNDPTCLDPGGVTFQRLARSFGTHQRSV